MLKTVIVVAAASLATAVSLIAIALYAHNRDERQADINKAVCLSVVKLDAAITDSLRRSLVQLPKLQYYRDHPDELQTQRSEVRRSLANFVPPKECVNHKLTGR